MCEERVCDYFKQIEADIFCVQETKLQEGQITLEIGDKYHQYWNYALKRGYSGTAIFSKSKRDLSRLEYRLEWEDRFRRYLLQLDVQTPVIDCGDLNAAHQEIDLKNAKGDRGN